MKKTLVVIALALGALYALKTVASSRTWQFSGEIVPRVETSRKVVALTFDDGPEAEPVSEILQALGTVKATFFVCGAGMAANPGVAEKLAAGGHELGNHSFTHQRMWLKTRTFIADEIERTDALIRAAGQGGAIHFRAPYCKKLVALPRYLDETGRIHVTFDVEPESVPEIDADAALIAAHVLERVRPGSIVLLHPWYRNRSRTRQAIPAIVEGLHARGYEFVTVSELLAMRQRPGK